MLTHPLHHAYVIEGDKDSILVDLFADLKEHYGMEREGNPDFVIHEVDTLGIDHARSLAYDHIKRPLQSPRRVFIFAFNKILHEAQNALLKVFEEPSKYATLILITPSAQSLLPTLLSRVERITHASLARESERNDARAFLASTISERMARIKKLIDAKDDEKTGRFVAGLIGELRSHGLDKNASALGEVLFVEQYLGDRGASHKMLLEHLAHVL